jgi:hypothetical protein
MKKLDLIRDHCLVGRSIVDVEMIGTRIDAELNFKSTWSTKKQPQRGQKWRQHRDAVVSARANSQYRAGLATISLSQRRRCRCTATVGSLRRSIREPRIAA